MPAGDWSLYEGAKRRRSRGRDPRQFLETPDEKAFNRQRQGLNMKKRQVSGPQASVPKAPGLQDQGADRDSLKALYMQKKRRR